MSCNGCRVLRKGCSEDCMLRQALESINNPQAQANATVFVAKFFGRAGLMSFISSVPRNQRRSLFQSLLFEAVGRTVNPVSGAVGLLWTGNWTACQTAVMTVLRGGTVEPMQGLDKRGRPGPELDNVSESCSVKVKAREDDDKDGAAKRKRKRKRGDGAVDDDDDEDEDVAKCGPADLDLGLMHRRAATPSEESETTTFGSETGSYGNCGNVGGGGETKLLRLFI